MWALGLNALIWAKLFCWPGVHMINWGDFYQMESDRVSYHGGCRLSVYYLVWVEGVFIVDAFPCF